MRKLLIIFPVLLSLAGCSSDGNGTPGDNYDRSAMLTHWADDIIIPAYGQYVSKVGAMKVAATSFIQSPDQAGLETLRENWLEAYTAFQHVALFNIGTAESMGFTAMANTYPADAAGIEANIASGSYNLSQLSQFSREGFPGIDYLINGSATDDAAIVAKFQSSPAYGQYLNDVVEVMSSTAASVHDDWTGGYRDTYVASTGNSVSSSTNKTVNAFVKSMERDIRNAKVGIPAGKLSNGATFPEKVEAYYKNDVSKLLLDQSLQAAQDFFNGKNFSGSQSGPSLKSYLDYVNATSDGAPLSDVIAGQFAAVQLAFSGIDDSFSQQITSNNAQMLTAYESLQQLVVLTKLDMMQALNITIDYVDGDGD